MLTRSLASEWGQYNIQVNGIAPGYIATPQTAPLRQDGNPFNEYIKARTPANRWGTPEDLKGPCVFLASKASDFVNGHVLLLTEEYLRTSANSHKKGIDFGEKIIVL